jgi:predicted RNase H-like HicB family nuclease/predicted RNA binding protein YcfA (HicA-like mRNA interferase family)
MVASKFTVFLEPAEEGGFIVKCVELPVATQGETREEALKNIKEAIEGYLEVKTELFDRKIKGEKAEVIVEAPLLFWRKVVKALTKAGFQVARQKGSHLILIKNENIVPVPKHKEIKRGLLMAIIFRSRV